MSFRVSDQLYNCLRNTGLTFKEVGEPALLQYLEKYDSHNNDDFVAKFFEWVESEMCTPSKLMYTPVYNKEIEDKYQETRAEIDVFLSRLEAE